MLSFLKRLCGEGSQSVKTSLRGGLRMRYAPLIASAESVARYEVAGRQAVLLGDVILGVFPGDGHLNLGDSDEWSDRERFVERALTIAREHLSEP